LALPHPSIFIIVLGMMDETAIDDGNDDDDDVDENFDEKKPK